MFKKSISVLLLSIAAVTVWAYAPPAAGQLTYQITTPDVLAGGATVAGGAFEYSSVAHAAVNPALTAPEQRIVADAAATVVFGTIGGEKKMGVPSFYAGLVLPTKMGVFSASGQGLFANFDNMALGNTFTGRGGFAKEIDEKLNVGADLYLSIGSTNAGFDWALGTDLGFTYDMGSWKYLPFMSDIRWGAALTGLGKNLHSVAGSYSAFPGIFTPSAGIAGTLFTWKALSGAAAVDLSVPSFQDVAFSALFDLHVSDFLSVKTGWNFDLLETLNKTASYLPYVTVGVTFGHTSKDDSFLSKMGGQESEFNLGGTWRQLTNDVTAYSAGATIKLGLPDTSAPAIVLWEDEE